MGMSGTLQGGGSFGNRGEGRGQRREDGASLPTQVMGKSEVRHSVLCV